MKSRRPGNHRVISAAVIFALGGSSAALQAQNSSAQAPTSALEEIVVTSSRVATPVREIGTAVSVITGEEIQLRGYQSMADVLRTQPGIGVSNSGGPGKVTAVRIRGEESYRTLVMIDGVEVSDPTGTQVGPNFSSLLTTSDIQRVEVLRGPQGFIYGADSGGVINIMTRTGEGEVGGQLDVELGDFGTRQIDANIFGGSEKVDYFFSIADIDTDGFNARASDTVLVDDDGYQNTTMHTKLGWKPGEDLRLQLVARDIDASNDFDQCGFPTTHQCRGNTEQTTFRVSADLRKGDFTHLFAYGNTDIARANFANDSLSFGTEGKLTRIEYTGSYRPSDAVTLVYGIDLEEEDIISSSGDRIERDQTGYYVEYQGRFADRFFVTVGARSDDNDDFGSHTSARATAAFLNDLDSGATIKYRASIGTGFRAPSLSEIAYNAGPFAFPPASGVALKEESSSGFDIGVDYSTASGLRLEATYFDQEIEDEIFFDLSGFSGYLQSLGISESTGIELAAEVPIGEQWAFLGNLTYNDTENTEDLQRIRRPERLSNLGMRYTSADSRLRVFANYRMSSDSVDEIFGFGRIALPDYEVLDLSVAYALNDSLEFFGRVENATDEVYEEVTGFLTGGSTASAGIRLKF